MPVRPIDNPLLLRQLLNPQMAQAAGVLAGEPGRNARAAGEGFRESLSRASGRRVETAQMIARLKAAEAERKQRADAQTGRSISEALRGASERDFERELQDSEHGNRLAVAAINNKDADDDDLVPDRDAWLMQLLDNELMPLEDTILELESDPYGDPERIGETVTGLREQRNAAIRQRHGTLGPEGQSLLEAGYPGAFETERAKTGVLDPEGPLLAPPTLGGGGMTPGQAEARATLKAGAKNAVVRGLGPALDAMGGTGTTTADLLGRLLGSPATTQPADPNDLSGLAELLAEYEKQQAR